MITYYNNYAASILTYYNKEADLAKLDFFLPLQPRTLMEAKGPILILRLNNKYLLSTNPHCWVAKRAIFLGT
jgi:hypothetical protein